MPSDIRLSNSTRKRKGEGGTGSTKRQRSLTGKIDPSGPSGPAGSSNVESQNEVLVVQDLESDDPNHNDGEVDSQMPDAGSAANPNLNLTTVVQKNTQQLLNTSVSHGSVNHGRSVVINHNDITNVVDNDQDINNLNISNVQRLEDLNNNTNITPPSYGGKSVAMQVQPKPPPIPNSNQIVSSSSSTSTAPAQAQSSNRKYSGPSANSIITQNQQQGTSTSSYSAIGQSGNTNSTNSRMPYGVSTVPNLNHHNNMSTTNNNIRDSLTATQNYNSNDLVNSIPAARSTRRMSLSNMMGGMGIGGNSNLGFSQVPQLPFTSAGSIWDVCRAVESIDWQLAPMSEGSGVNKHNQNNNNFQKSSDFANNLFGNGNSGTSSTNSNTTSSSSSSTSSQTFCLTSTLAVPAVLSDVGFQRLSRSLGAPLRASWKKNSSLGQRRPVLVHFRPITERDMRMSSMNLKKNVNDIDNLNSGNLKKDNLNHINTQSHMEISNLDASSLLESQDINMYGGGGQGYNLDSHGTTNQHINNFDSTNINNSSDKPTAYPQTKYYIYESTFNKSGARSWGPRREVSSVVELETFISQENDKCGDTVLLHSPTRIEIATGVLGRPVTGGRLGSPLGGGQSQSQNQNYVNSLLTNSEVQILDLPNITSSSSASGGSGGPGQSTSQWPSWVSTLCKGKPVLLESQQVSGLEDYLVLGMGNLNIGDLINQSTGLSPWSQPTQSIGIGGGGSCGSTSESIDLLTFLEALVHIRDNKQLILSSNLEQPMFVKDNSRVMNSLQIVAKGFSNRLNQMQNQMSMNDNSSSSIPNPSILLDLTEKFLEARSNFIQYLTSYHEKCFCNQIAPHLAKQLQSKMAELDESHRYFMSLDRSAETALILARNAGASVAACTVVLMEGSIRQNYTSTQTLNSSESVSLNLQQELILFGKENPDLPLPHRNFLTWTNLGEYYITHEKFKSNFFDEELSGGSALFRLLKECQASTLFATPLLPDNVSDIKEFLRKELSQCGGVGISSTTWQDVVTKIFANSTHKVLQSQIQYTTRRLEWFLKRQKTSVLQWMLDLEYSADSQWYSQLYSKHGNLLVTRHELRKAVFQAYDSAISESCQNFDRIFQGVLSAIYNNPNSFLSKQMLSETMNIEDPCDEEKFCEYILKYIGDGQGGKRDEAPHRTVVLRLNPQNTHHTSSSKSNSIKRRVIVDSRTARKDGYCSIFGRNPALTTETIDDNRISSTHFALSFREHDSSGSNGTGKENEAKNNKKNKDSNTNQNQNTKSLHLVLSDMSTNGTYINDVRLGKNKNREIKVGDKISLLLQNKDVSEAESLWYSVEYATPLDLAQLEQEGLINTNGSASSSTVKDINMGPPMAATPAQMQTALSAGDGGDQIMDVDMNGGGQGGQDTNMNQNMISTTSSASESGTASASASSEKREYLEPDPQKRLRSAVSRVRSEMVTKRKSGEILKKLDRAFDAQDVDVVLQDATVHILNAFSHIKNWLSRNVPLFAAAFLVKPLSHILLDRMHLLQESDLLDNSTSSSSDVDMNFSNGAVGSSWREHANQLEKIEREMRHMQKAGELLMRQQRVIMRARTGKGFNF